MKSSLMRKTMVALSAGALLMTLVATVPAETSAANLTGGQYTYVISGEEVLFQFDPIVRKDGLLLPIDVFQKFGIEVINPLTRTITLKKSGVKADVTLGSTTMLLNDQAQAVATMPMRLNGRLFFPADILRHFGIEYSQDGNYVAFTNLAENLPDVQTLPDADYQTLKSSKTVSAQIRVDNNLFLNSEFTLLTTELLSAGNLNLTYGNRAKLNSLLQTNTLLLVKLSNTAYRAGTVNGAGLYLVDQKGNQYDFAAAVDIGTGNILGKIMPGGERMGVLSFPKVTAGPQVVTLYYEPHNASLGQFKVSN